jgi:hypothetical protein
MSKKQAVKKEKEVTKIAEDRTFGMKNKNKSKQVSNVVKGILAQQKGGYEKLKAEIYNEKRDRERMEEERKLMADVFANAAAKTIQTVTGDEIIICKMFEAGLCNKGKKCKFSHAGKPDLMKTDKIDLFTDQRDQLFGNKDTIEHWDSEKLKEVVGFNQKKYGGENRTEKICKNFLDAVEKRQYGWGWQCPSGFDCVFRHCLPEGYELQRDKKVEKEVKITDDEVIEEIDHQREKMVTTELTPVTQESFFTWLAKRKVRLEKENEEKVAASLKSLGIKSKRGTTGRELFEKDKDIFRDADDAVEEYEREEEVPEEVADDNVEVNEELFDDEVPDL